MRLTLVRTGVGVVAPLISLLLLGGCASDTTSEDPSAPVVTAAGTTVLADDAADPTELDRHDSVQALAEGLDRAGLNCALEYEGLQDGDRTLSLCVIDGEQALLTIWSDPAVLADFVNTEAGDAMAYGNGWTIEVDTSGLAAQIAEALGGAVPGDPD